MLRSHELRNARTLVKQGDTYVKDPRFACRSTAIPFNRLIKEDLFIRPRVQPHSWRCPYFPAVRTCNIKEENGIQQCETVVIIVFREKWQSHDLLDCTNAVCYVITC